MSSLISVIVPIYNVELYLETCIKSICRQTYKQLEIILINDGSTDGSEAICLKYAKMDSRIHYYKKENGGLSDARNYGIVRANGGYLAFVDSDDWIEPNFIQSLYESILREGASVAVTGYNRVDAFGCILETDPLPTKQTVLSGREVCKQMLESNGYRFVVVWNKLYKKELFKFLHFKKGKLHEDEYFTYRLLYDVEKVAVVQDCLYQYVERDNSITTSRMSEHRFNCLVEYQRDRIDFYRSKEDTELLTQSCYTFLEFIIWFLIRNRQWLTKKQISLLQTHFRDTFRQLQQFTGIGINKRIYYLLGCINLRIYTLLRRVKRIVFS
ncbi:glycosyltransferase [Streptococcus suis]|nr:glycosyltransferase [Streptococcus suis]